MQKGDIVKRTYAIGGTTGAVGIVLAVDEQTKTVWVTYPNKRYPSTEEFGWVEVIGHELSTMAPTVPEPALRKRRRWRF